MSPATSLLLILLLILASAFFSIAEMALAASRRIRLRQMADEGDARAELNLRTGRIDLSRDGITTHDPQLLAEFREEVKKQMPHDEELSNAVVDSRQVVAALGL